MSKILVKSPTRVDLAGGTLDLWPLYMFVGGAKTVNVAIDIFTYVELEVLPDRKIEVESEDLGLRKVYTDYAQAIADTDPKMALFRAQFEYWKPTFGFKLKTKSESPVGGGLGGSSSLTISLLKAFSKACLKSFANNNEMVKLAHNLEARILLTPTGTQDYYPAISGGINILDYQAGGIRQEILQMSESDDFSQRFLLVHTGKSHHSGLNNFEVLKGAVEKNAKTIRALSALKQISEQMAALVRAGQWNSLSELFNQEYEARIQLAPAFSSPEIETLKIESLKAGADAVKICGAGGGGCVMVWCPPEQKENIAKHLERQGFQVLKAKPFAPFATQD